MVPGSHLAQKDIQVHMRGKKPERNLRRFGLHIHVMSNIIDSEEQLPPPKKKTSLQAGSRFELQDKSTI